MKINELALCGILLWGLILVKGQASPLVNQDDVQSWNDIQFNVPVSKHVDYWTQVTIRLGKNIKRLNEARYAIGFIYKPHKAWTFHPYYWFIKARNSRGILFNESRLNLRISCRFPIKSFGLSHRSWFEYRIRNAGNSWRYRPSLTFEKDIKFFPNAKLFLTDEVFYDSGLKKITRNRITVGIIKSLSKNLAVDLYYTRQNDGFSRPGDLHVIGTNWKIKL